MDPELLSGSGSRIIFPDPDSAKSERAEKLKFYFSFQACEFWIVCSMKQNMADSWQIILLIEYQVCFFNFQIWVGSGINHSGSATPVFWFVITRFCPFSKDAIFPHLEPVISKCPTHPKKRLLGKSVILSKSLKKLCMFPDLTSSVSGSSCCYLFSASISLLCFLYQLNLWTITWTITYGR